MLGHFRCHVKFVSKTCLLEPRDLLRLSYCLVVKMHTFKLMLKLPLFILA